LRSMRVCSTVLITQISYLSTQANSSDSSSDRYGPPAGIGALTRTRTRQNPYPRSRVRVGSWVGGRPATRATRQRTTSFSSASQCSF
jgi:hypothetical protein